MDSSRFVYEFGEYSLDRDERVLRRNGSPVPLTPKATDILLALVDRHGHIVDKEALMRHVWPDTAVEESNLTQNVYTLRKVLGGGEGRCPFIETVPRRGYRFVGSVRMRVRTPADLVHVQPEDAALPVAARVEATASAPRGSVAPDRDGEAVATYADPGTRPARTRDRLGWALAAVATGAAAAGVFWAIQHSSRVGGSAHDVTPRVTRVTHVGTVVRATISPDGRSLAYATSAGAHESLWLKRLNSASARQLMEPAIGTYRRGGGLTYAPGGWLYYTWFQRDLAAVGVFRIRDQGGTPERLPNVWDLPSFDPRGERFACITTTSSSIRESRLLVYDANGQSPQVVAMRAPPMTFLQMRPAWSPDGKELAAWSMSERAPLLRDLVVVSLSGARERTVTRQQLHTIDGMVWSSDGSSVVVSAREQASSPLRLWRIPLRAPLMRPLTTDISDYLLASSTDDGRQLAAVRVDVARTLWVGPLTDLSRARQVESDAGELAELESIAWMPDGRVLYTSAESGNADIWVLDPATNRRRQLTSSPHDDFSPASSPDGRTIVFASDRAGVTGLWTMTDAGESSVRQLTSGGDSRPSITAEGTVVFQRGIIQSAPIALWRVPVEGGDAVRLTEGTSIRPAVSPDGRFVAYYWLTPERWVLAVLAMDGGQPLKVFPLSSTHCGRTVRWSPDSRTIAYIDCEGGVSNIWSHRLDGSRRRKLTELRSGHIETFDWSPDGSQLAWITRSQVSDVVLIAPRGGMPPS
jgi:Tol biopolymer transport system component/DNA-binding winged helix-turn-helix (wHTH) protein